MLASMVDSVWVFALYVSVGLSAVEKKKTVVKYVSADGSLTMVEISPCERRTQFVAILSNCSMHYPNSLHPCKHMHVDERSIILFLTVI